MSYELTEKLNYCKRRKRSEVVSETRDCGDGRRANIHKISVWSLFRIKLIYSIVYQRSGSYGDI